MPNLRAASSISLQFLRTTAASRIAAGVCTSLMYLPTNCSFTAAGEALGKSEDAYRASSMFLKSERKDSLFAS